MDMVDGSLGCATAVPLVVTGAADFFPRPLPVPDLSDSRRGLVPSGSADPLSPVLLAAAG